MSFKNTKWKNGIIRDERIAVKVTAEQKEIWNKCIDKFGKVSKVVDYIFEKLKNEIN